LSLKRVNVTLPDELHQWFKNESKRTGMTVNALMQTALNNYYNQQVIIPNIPEMMEMFKEQKRNNE
jgi:predicted DNA-binding protein